LPEPTLSEASRYTRRAILRSERMYGHGYQSPGGTEAVRRLTALAPVPAGGRVLDIGSGLGGASLHFASELKGCSVLGLDAAPAMIDLSRERLRERAAGQPDLEHRVDFQLGDICTAPVPAGAFDLAWTRDVFLYVEPKRAAWRAVARALRPGGYLVGTDFCLGERGPSPEFAAYAASCGYHLQRLADYAATLRECGLHVHRMDDVTSWFVELLRAEAERFESRRAEFLAEFDEEEFDALRERWRAKIAFSEAGDLAWGLMVAEKRARASEDGP
jgi:phosphoethanolamine N-methyltransferase